MESINLTALLTFVFITTLTPGPNNISSSSMGILFGWGFFFYQFHGLLFSSGSWAFAATDSLMRLYPEQFFFDVAVMMSGGTWLLGFGLMLIGYFLAWRCAQTEKQKRLVTYVAKTVQ